MQYGCWPGPPVLGESRCGRLEIDGSDKIGGCISVR